MKFLLVCLSAISLSFAFAAEPNSKFETRKFKASALSLSGLRVKANLPDNNTPADPFAAPNPPSGKAPSEATPPLGTAFDMLKAQGIELPEGSTATFDPTTSELVVTSSPDALDQTDALMRGYDHAPRALTFLLHIIQLPFEAAQHIVQRSANSNNQTAELDQLTTAAAQPDSHVSFVSSASIETKPGTRCEIQAVRQHRWATEASPTKNGHLEVGTAVTPLGLRFELDPVLGPDGKTIDLTFAINASSSDISETTSHATDLVSGKDILFPTSKRGGQSINTNITLISGSTRLVAQWKPKDVPDIAGQPVTWLAFLTARAVPQLAPPSAYQITPSKPLPANWKCAVFPIPAHLGGDGTDIRKPGESATAYFKRRGIELPAGSVIDADDSGNLRVTSSLPVLEHVAVLIEEITSHVPKTVNFTFHTVQAPGSLLRPLAAAASSTSDARAQLQTLFDAAAKNQAIIISTDYFETKSGNTSLHSSATDIYHISNFLGLDDKKPKQRKLTPDITPQGLSIVIDPVLGPDSQTIDLHFAYQRNTAPEEHRTAEFRDASSTHNYRLPFTDFHEAKLSTSIATINGAIKLLSLWRPTGKAEFMRDDVLEAVFVTSRVVTVIPEIVASPKELELKKPVETNDQTIYRRTFPVPPDLTATCCDDGGTNGTPRPRITAQDILESQGIQFPVGASVEYKPGTDRLIVKNTLANLALVEEFVATLANKAPKNIAVTLRLFQVPAIILRPLLAKASTQQDHRPLLVALTEAEARHEATGLATLKLETKPGNRARMEQVSTQTFVSEISTSEQGDPSINTDDLSIGTTLEIDPVLGPDGYTVDLTWALNHNPSDPVLNDERFSDPLTGHEINWPLPRLPRVELRGDLTTTAGTMRLLRVWKPTGPEFEGKDLLQCALLETRIITAE